jgi:hypothetical protein
LSDPATRVEGLTPETKARSGLFADTSGQFRALVWGAPARPNPVPALRQGPGRSDHPARASTTGSPLPVEAVLALGRAWRAWSGGSCALCWISERRDSGTLAMRRETRGPWAPSERAAAGNPTAEARAPLLFGQGALVPWANPGLPRTERRGTRGSADAHISRGR